MEEASLKFLKNFDQTGETDLHGDYKNYSSKASGESKKKKKKKNYSKFHSFL